MKIKVDLAGKTALVTGGSSGLGVHFARVLAESGAKVIIGARRAEALAALAEEINASGGNCRAVTLDVTDAASISAIAAEIAEVDILVNNAGISREMALLDLSGDDWDATLDTNAKGLFLMTQAVARAMKDRGTGGSIINIASILGLRQGGRVAAYAASKAAAIQLTKVSALELARYGIRVNAIAPGYILTDLNADFFATDAGEAMIRRVAQRRLGNPDDIDGALLLLASDSSSFMTGTVITVDGGHLLSTL